MQQVSHFINCLIPDTSLPVSSAYFFPNLNTRIKYLFPSMKRFFYLLVTIMVVPDRFFQIGKLRNCTKFPTDAVWQIMKYPYLLLCIYTSI